MKTMIRIYCICAALLTCACSAPGPSAPQTVPPAASVAGSPPAAATGDGPTKEMGIEGHVVLGKVPAPGSSSTAAALRLRYPDKAAFLADVQTAHPVQAVVLDGSAVWQGFGPALSYRTNLDGSISR
jgi:hypothetical protein